MILEEDEQVLKALKRLPPQEAYDRVYRLRRAVQCSVTAKILPKDQWTKPEEVSSSPTLTIPFLSRRGVSTAISKACFGGNKVSSAC